MNKDWTGNHKTTFTTLGASSHSDHEREEHDFYATDPAVVKPLIEMVQLNTNIWEPACGMGHLSKEFEKYGFVVKSTDLIDRGYGVGGIDFLNSTEMFNGDIVTNPPFKYAQEFIEKALSLIPDGNNVVMFLKVQFLEGQKRQTLFKQRNLKEVLVFSKRQKCAINAQFEGSGSSAVAYCWYFFKKGYVGDPIIKWIN